MFQHVMADDPIKLMLQLLDEEDIRSDELPLGACSLKTRACHINARSGHIYAQRITPSAREWQQIATVATTYLQDSHARQQPFERHHVGQKILFTSGG